MKCYSERTLDVRLSPVRKVLERAREIENEGKRVIHFEIGEPDFDTPHCIVKRAQEALDHHDTHYTANRGLLSLRQAIADRIREKTTAVYDPAREILLTAGAAEAILDIVLGLVDPGDEIIGFSPAFMNYRNVACLAGARFIEIPLKAEQQFQIDIDAVKEALSPKTRMIIVNNPQNPCGTVHQQDRLKSLAQIAVEHDLLILSDEIYDSILYENVTFSSIAAFPGMKERTILVNGFSKAFAMTGWRVGYLAADQALFEAILKVHQYNTCCLPGFVQTALSSHMNQREGLRAVEAMADQFARRRAILLDGLGRIPALRFVPPLGAFYIFIDVSSTGMDGETFATRLLEEQQVATVPGKGFGADYGDFIRLSYATSEEDIQEGLRRIFHFCQSPE